MCMWGKDVSLTWTFFPLLFLPLWSIGLIFQFHDHFTDCRTPWTGDQLVARPLPKHRITQTQNKCIHTPNIHAYVVFERTIPASERVETVHALDRSDTVTNLHGFSNILSRIGYVTGLISSLCQECSDYLLSLNSAITLYNYTTSSVDESVRLSLMVARLRLSPTAFIPRLSFECNPLLIYLWPLLLN
jgi:hypothetical protein